MQWYIMVILVVIRYDAKLFPELTFSTDIYKYFHFCTLFDDCGFYLMTSLNYLWLSNGDI